MKSILKKLTRVVPGLAVFALGLYLNGYSALGYAPWNVLADGVAQVFSITFGMATIVIGAFVFIAVIALKEPLGVGSFLNMALAGTFVDLYARLQSSYGLLPELVHFPAKLFVCILSILVTSLGTYLYMSTQWGAGPRDSLLVALTRRLPFRYTVIRIAMEAAVFLVGFAMGGVIGVGTVLNVIFLGMATGCYFKLFKFDVKNLKNENFIDTWNLLRRKQPVPQAETPSDGAPERAEAAAPNAIAAD